MTDRPTDERTDILIANAALHCFARTKLFETVRLTTVNFWGPISYRYGVIVAYCSNFGHCVFEPSFYNVLCSSGAHWKARSELTISVN